MNIFKIEDLIDCIKVTIPVKGEKIYTVEQLDDQSNLIRTKFVIRERKVCFFNEPVIMSSFPIQNVKSKEKDLIDITEEEAINIALLCDAKMVRYKTSTILGKDPLITPIISITTKDIRSGDNTDEVIWIFQTGKIIIHYNTGNWGGSGYEQINTLPITDYLREQGYQFKY